MDGLYFWRVRRRIHYPPQLAGKRLIFPTSMMEDRDYLNGREVTARVTTALFSWIKVASGVWQGSVSGPLLFLI